MRGRALIPQRVFFTKGVGVAPHKLQSLEWALRDAGISACNLVRVSSILPPHCKQVSKEVGLEQLRAGQIVYCVLADAATDEPQRLIAASIGYALPKSREQYGYLAEHHTYGQTSQATGQDAEELAAAMLAATLGAKFDPKKSWNQQEQAYQIHGSPVKTGNVTQWAKGHPDGLWTTVLAVAVFVPEDQEPAPTKVIVPKRPTRTPAKKRKK
ncbi:MAG: arginine decarboxylase, pyruvoyl-dependent [Deinococcus sp.]|nr:arginine decarboxylase, pyruvoyl-dependent [Deinococcus sp.]